MYSVGRCKARAKEGAWRSLVFDSLQNIPQGKYIPHSLDDLLRPRQEIDVCDIIDRVARALDSE